MRSERKAEHQTFFCVSSCTEFSCGFLFVLFMHAACTWLPKVSISETFLVYSHLISPLLPPHQRSKSFLDRQQSTKSPKRGVASVLQSDSCLLLFWLSAVVPTNASGTRTLLWNRTITQALSKPYIKLGWGSIRRILRIVFPRFNRWHLRREDREGLEKDIIFKAGRPLLSAVEILSRMFHIASGYTLWRAILKFRHRFCMDIFEVLT